MSWLLVGIENNLRCRPEQWGETLIRPQGNPEGLEREPNGLGERGAKRSANPLWLARRGVPAPPKHRRCCALPAHHQNRAEVRATVANAPACWSAAGSEAPRRFGCCGCVAPELGVSTAVGRRSKARRCCALPAHSKRSACRLSSVLLCNPKIADSTHWRPARANRGTNTRASR